MTTECALCGQRFEFDDPDQLFCVLVGETFELVCDPCTEELAAHA